MRFRTILAACIALALAFPAFADKFSDFGLDSHGRPWSGKSSRPGVSGIYLVKNGSPHFVTRPILDSIASPERRVRRVLAMVMAGGSPSERAAGLESPFPVGSSIVNLDVADGNYRIDVALPESYLLAVADKKVSIELLVRCLIDSLDSEDMVRFEMRVKDPWSGNFVPPQSFEPQPKVQRDSRTRPDRATPIVDDEPLKAQIPVPGDSRPTGSLTGKAVFLNPGHGWVFRDSDPDFWGLQRTFVENNIEDFSNVDTVNQWLIAYLWNAGADVFSVREPDPQEAMVVIDNDDGTPAYVESGSGWFDSSLDGFANGHSPYLTGQDPFAYGGNRLAACTVGAPSAWATFTADIPSDGWYWVSVSHGAYTNRSPQAHYAVHHAGGVSDVFIDQRRRRFTWIPLGRFFFEASAPASERQVVLSNESSSTSHYVSADAVRFGGGLGVISRGTVGTSGEPGFDEEARYHLQFSGAPADTVYDRSATDENDGWSGRPKFGGWLAYQSTLQGAPPEESIFISSHTNAGGGTGLSTFVYTGYEGTVHDRLRDAVHDEVLNDLTNGYPGTYGNHGTGKKYGTYGENNPSNTAYATSPAMPIFLGEWLFHDSPSDMAMYHDPAFRRILARAIFQGVVRFFAAEYGSQPTLSPEPPQHLNCRQTGPTSVEISWEPPPADGLDVAGDPPSGYRLYRGSHGRGFPPATDIGDAGSVVVTDVVPGRTEFVYVTATNAGGESLPSEVLAFRIAADATGRILIVNGFDKLDLATRVRVPWDGGTLYRHLIHRMNTQDFVVEHARAVEAAAPRLSFDSCEDEVVESGGVVLADYDAVVWIGGVQSEVNTADPTDDTSLTPIQQNQLSSYLSGGGRLFLSSAELAWDLDRSGTTTFVDTELHANYVQDDSGYSSVTGLPGSIFASLGPMNFDDGTGTAYAVNYPEVIEPVDGAVAAMAYGTTGSGLAAAIQYRGTSRVVYLGIPFETLVEENDRTQVMSAALGFFGLADDPALLFADDFESGDTGEWSANSGPN